MLDSLQALHPDSNFDLPRAAQTLRAMAGAGKPLNTEQEVDGDGEDFLQARLTLVHTRGKLRLTLFRGPL